MLAKRLLEAAQRCGMRVIHMPGADGLCAVQCRRCGWSTPRDVVATRYAAEPHGCIVCEGAAEQGALTPCPA